MEPNERPQTPYAWPNGTYPVYGSGLLPSPYMMAPPSPLSAPSHHISPYLFSPHPGSDWWSHHYMPPPPPPHIHSSYYGNGASGIPWAPPPLLAAPPSMNPYSQLSPPPPPWINPPPPVHMTHQHQHQHQENNVENDDNDKDVVSPAVPTPASPSSVPSIDNDNDNDASYVPPSMTTATPATTSTTTSKLQRNNSVAAPASASILPKKRRSKVVDRKTIELPLALGWRRQVRRREPVVVVVEGTSSPAKTEVVYVAPCGKRLRSYAAIDDYINAHDLADRLALENFSFSAKLLVGDVVDAVAVVATANERRRQTPSIDATGLPSLGSRIATFPYSSSAFGDVVMTCEFFATFRGFLRLVAPSSSSSSSSLDVDFLLRRDVVVDACRRLLTILIDERDEPIRTQCNGIVRGDDVNARTLSEILRLVLVAAAAAAVVVVDSTVLMRESFFALDVGVRATIVAFLVDEVAGSKAFGVHLERHQERVHALRKEKWSVECDLRRLKGTLDGEGAADEERLGTAAASDEESDAGDGDGNVGNNHLHTNAIDRAETKKEISKLTALKSQCQEKLHVAMKTLRSLSLGEDRHGRRYWCLPHCSSTGVFVEETERQRNTKENHFKKSSKVETSSPPIQEGWWLISDADQLAVVTKSLNRKDFREKELYKNLTEKVDRFSSRKKGFRINNLPSEPVDFSSETDREYEQLLEDITNLEERLLSASLQSKGWTPFSQETDGDGDSHYSSLEIASRRLIQIEQATERRYLKPPLQETKQLTSQMLAGGTGQSQEEEDDDDDNVGMATCDGDDDVPSVSEGLLLWRAAVSRATSPSQLQVCLIHLEKSISWEKSIMKVFCQVCCKGDNEALLLLCDGCDRGVHAYCCKPKLSGIPEGDWYCHSCVRNVSDENRCCLCSGSSTTGKIISCGQCPRTFHMRCLDPPMSRIPKEDWCCPVCVKLIESCSKISSPSKRQRNGGDDDDEDEDDVASSCLSILQDLERQPQSWPFLIPVNKKQVPSYYDIIENPMDFQTIRAKLKDGSYSRKDAFANDVRLVFANCRTFNEDDSEVGIAGLLLSKYFERRWKCN